LTIRELARTAAQRAVTQSRRQATMLATMTRATDDCFWPIAT